MKRFFHGKLDFRLLMELNNEEGETWITKWPALMPVIRCVCTQYPLTMEELLNVSKMFYHHAMFWFLLQSKCSHMHITRPPFVVTPLIISTLMYSVNDEVSHHHTFLSVSTPSFHLLSSLYVLWHSINHKKLQQTALIQITRVIITFKLCNWAGKEDSDGVYNVTCSDISLILHPFSIMHFPIH